MKKDITFKPFIKWVYSPNDGELHGKIGSARNGDPLPTLIKHYHHSLKTPSLSASK
jgi:hypothetical protein